MCLRSQSSLDWPHFLLPGLEGSPVIRSDATAYHLEVWKNLYFSWSGSVVNKGGNNTLLVKWS